tara:strand:- start:483 stop:1628 length:1146 start_codon:yes stop_codon:yes gene_type:complete
MKSKIFLLELINVLLNNYFYQFVIFLFFLKGDFNLISEITFVLAPLIFFKESLSSNFRTLLLSDKKNSFYKVFLKQRIIYATLVLIIYFFLINYFAISEDILFLTLIIILTKFMWINELKITTYEINSDTKKIIENLIFLMIVYIFFSYYVFFPSKNLLYIALIILVFLGLKFIYKHKINFFYIIKNFRPQKKIDYKLISTISINLVNLIWRISFFLLLEKEFSGILFSVFAIMSFPSSLYSNTIGMALETHSTKKIIFKKILLLYYFFILCILYYIFENKVHLLNDIILSNFFYITATFSFLGSVIMILAISKRIKIINSKKLKRKILFQMDIMYAVLNILSLVIVYFLFGSYFFSILFFISSIFSLIYYIYYNKLKYNE